MKVGILLIAHSRIGTELLGTATATLGHCPLPAEVIEVSPNSDPEALRRQADASVARLDQGAGVLVLTDAFGSTPSNVANRLCARSGLRVVAGLNLPMLIRVLNYPGLGLDGLADKALSGGRDGVLLCEPGSGAS